ncbi:MAG: UDP-N-acetylglucosamine 2-epimerase (non-hydrolyzing) [Bacteroidales bacterium]|nr:UDP-N-acetylglucosamine 2-epimerase (non-hydrolyzing) [Bacteroidales bacterium]
MKIISVVGARPNFMKIAPFIRAVGKYNSDNRSDAIEHLLVHTGQHYDDNMSDYFFKDLEIPEPCYNLEVGSGSHAEQVGNTMIKFERVIEKEKPDWVVVVGDVNATLACSVTAKKEQIKCCHIEAGLRSGDMTMPEEINRIVTDRLCDLLLTPDVFSTENLRKEGTPENRIRFAGNIMADTLDFNLSKASQLNLETIINDNLLFPGHEYRRQLLAGNYAVVTLHRPSNVDRKEVLSSLVQLISGEIARVIPVLWPVHPRTYKQLELAGLLEMLAGNQNIMLLKPLGYNEMLKLNLDSKIMLTDSGGLQEECTMIGTPCLTLRSTTERPITLRENGGTCVLTGNDIEVIRSEFFNSLSEGKKPFRPELWDGNTADRCLRAIIEVG